MRLIDWLIKRMLNYKVKKEPFMAWTWGIDEHTDISIITEEYYDDHYRYGTRTHFYKAESEEEDADSN